MISDDYPEGWASFTNVSTTLKAIVDERHGAGDALVDYYEMPRATGNDLSGCDGHPSVALDAKIAADAAPKLKAIMGW
jgi:hypothetical protein